MGPLLVSACSAAGQRMIKHVVRCANPDPDPPQSPERCRRVGETCLRWFVCGGGVDGCCAGGSTDEKGARGVCWCAVYIYVCEYGSSTFHHALRYHSLWHGDIAIINHISNPGSPKFLLQMHAARITGTESINQSTRPTVRGCLRVVRFLLAHAFDVGVQSRFIVGMPGFCGGQRGVARPCGRRCPAPKPAQGYLLRCDRVLSGSLGGTRQPGRRRCVDEHNDYTCNLHPPNPSCIPSYLGRRQRRAAVVTGRMGWKPAM
jgi:hypothetical protein